jgi:FkbM family methyltransferase
MLKFAKKIARKFLNSYFGSLSYRKASYAQEGEDLVVDRLLEGKQNGFYVEVGCHHPYRFSNTYLFYKRGWRGVCIDPLPGTKNLFNRERPRDICIEKGVDEKKGELTYFMFNEPALNTFDENLAIDRDNKKGNHIIRKTSIEVQSLASILNDLDGVPSIDILSVDVEGLDLQVLKSNDWEKFSPRIIIAECLAARISSISSDPVALYLSNLNYYIYAKTGNSIIFLKNQNPI